MQSAAGQRLPILVENVVLLRKVLRLKVQDGIARTRLSRPRVSSVSGVVCSVPLEAASLASASDASAAGDASCVSVLAHLGHLAVDEARVWL